MMERARFTVVRATEFSTSQRMREVFTGCRALCSADHSLSLPFSQNPKGRHGGSIRHPIKPSSPFKNPRDPRDAPTRKRAHHPRWSHARNTATYFSLEDIMRLSTKFIKPYQNVCYGINRSGIRRNLAINRMPYLYSLSANPQFLASAECHYR